MDNRKVYGQYIVGKGNEFKVKENKIHYGYEKSLEPEMYYIVHITGKVLGMYNNETFATNLAMGLDKRDQKILSDEIEKILINSPETNKKSKII